MTTDIPDTPSLDLGAASRQLTDMVVANPVPSVLAAAATGAGLMALIALMARPNSRLPSLSALTAMAREHLPSTSSLPSVPDLPDAPDLGSLKSQIADLLDRLGSAMPTKSDAKQKLQDAGDTAQSTWESVRDQAVSVIEQVQPQISAATTAATKAASAATNAATQVARDNPLWTAVVAGAVGTLIGAQFLGKLVNR